MTNVDQSDSYVALLREALMTLRSNKGHFGQCFHRIWINGHDNQPGKGHQPGTDCPADHPCGGKGSNPGEGSPCSQTCLRINRLLGLAYPPLKTSKIKRRAKTQQMELPLGYEADPR